ncbi:MAG: porin [Desulfobacterales bacterium]|nr:porin [Desulfobacterales bacterium]
MKKGMVAVVTAMLMLVAGSALASEWNFYGSARMSTFIKDTDSNTASKDGTSFGESLQANSRIGANIKVNDSLTARFEYGTGVNVRILAAEWDFGMGKLKVGQDYTPMEIGLSNMVFNGDENLNSYGNPYSGRHPMLQLTFGGFKIAAIETATQKDFDQFTDAQIKAASTETNMPKIEASYTHNFSKGFVKMVAGYNSYELTADGHEYDVDSYGVGIGGKVNLGRVFLGANVYGGQNTGAYGMSIAANDDPIFDNGTVHDSDTLGYILVAGMRVNDMLTCEAGYGWVQAESDKSGVEDDEASAAYVNATITLADGVIIVPEVGYIDNDKDRDGNEEDDTVYYGAKWQINF